jgi:hypothetical protein
MSYAPQTSVTSTPQYGVPGAPCDLDAERNNRTDTYINEEASAGIPFGFVVKLGSNNVDGGLVNGAKLPSAKTDKLIGFSTWSPGFSRGSRSGSGDEVDDTGIRPKVHFGVTERGALWILPEEDLVPGDQVHARVTANSGKLPGMIGKTDDGVRTIDITPFAQVRSAGGPTSGQPCRVVFDFTNAALAKTDS